MCSPAGVDPTKATAYGGGGTTSFGGHGANAVLMNSTMASRCGTMITLMSSASQMKFTVSTVPWMMLKTPGGIPACRQASGAPISASAQPIYSLQSLRTSLTCSASSARMTAAPASFSDGFSRNVFPAPVAIGTIHNGHITYAQSGTRLTRSSRDGGRVEPLGAPS